MEEEAYKEAVNQFKKKVIQIAANNIDWKDYEKIYKQSLKDKSKLDLLAIKIQKQITAPTALIYGGETTVTVRGSGKGGRNQEMTLTAAKYLDGTNGITFLSAGSDGTDGPTDAAGGIADGRTAEKMRQNGVDIDLALNDNASYNALKSSGSLLITGATGTNVNDLTLVLIDISNT